MYELQRKLKDLRRSLAEGEGLELFMVFGNATIDELCAKLPKNEEELLQVKGMGEKKVKKYGREILRIIHGYTDSTDGTDRRGEEVVSNSPDFVKATTGKQFLILNKNAETAVILDSGLPASDQSVGVVETGLSSVALAKGEMTNPGEPIHRHATPDNQSEKQKVTVSQYIEYLNLVLQRSADVRVVGEVSSGKMYPSGYYFTLKDMEDETALSCYIPTYTYRGLGLPLEDGMQVAVEGVPRMVKRNGRFQFTVENVQLVGEGALKKTYDLLKTKLQREGLFDRKRPLPEFITSVGVITSRAGAVIHDFRNNLAKLGIKVYLKDVRVEGTSSAGMVMGALKYFNALSLREGGSATTKQSNDGNEDEIAASTRSGPPRNDNAVDVIVLMRGGGSLEDMQAFNDERVVRAVFGSRIPTIVSIGHDKDVPLAQLAADVMVSTPTAAAHAVSASWNRLAEDVPTLQAQLVYAFSERLSVQRSKFALNAASLINWCSRLGQSHARLREKLVAQIDVQLQWITNQKIGLIGHMGRIGQISRATLEQVGGRLKAAEGVLEQVNPERQLRLGYSIVKTGSGKVVRSVKDVKLGDGLVTQVSDGTIHSVVGGV